MHIVRAPAPPGQGGDPSRRRKPRPRSLTDVEAMRLRGALRHLRALLGGWDVLASMMSVHPDTVRRIAHGAQVPGIAIARSAAQAAGKTLDALLAGPTDASKCPLCGRGAP